MGSLILAVRFLTVVPVPGREVRGVAALGRAAWWFPVVGLLLGIGLDGTLAALQALFPPLLASALLVTAWKVVSVVTAASIPLRLYSCQGMYSAGRNRARRHLAPRSVRSAWPHGCPPLPSLLLA